MIYGTVNFMSDVYDGTQPLPVPNDGPSMHDLVIKDMEARKAFGLAKYGALLQAGNGRDALQDLYDELLDAIVYTRQLLEERPVVVVDAEVCPHDCDNCHGEDCPCDRLGCAGSV